MFPQIFRFSQPGEQVLLNAILAANPGASITGADVTFGAPVVTAAPAVTVEVQPAANVPALGISGNVTVSYNRLDIGAYFQGVTPTLNASNGSTAADLVAALMNAYQIYFAADSNGADVMSACSFTYDNVSVPPTATLTAAATNLVWQGSVAFNLSGEQTLTSILPNVTLSDLSAEPALTAGQSYAEAYYGTNYNVAAQGLILAALTQGSSLLTSAGSWDLGAAITNDPWVWSATPVAYNVNGAVVAYNGVATGDYALAGALASLYTNVCVITLDSTNCTNLVGHLVIPYNPTGGSGN